MSTTVSTTYGYGLKVDGEFLAELAEAFQSGPDFDEERDEDGVWGYLERLLKDYELLAYDMPYMYDYYDNDVVIYIASTTRSFYWVGPHEMVADAVRVTHEEALELQNVAERLGVGYAPGMYLTTTIG